MTPGQWARVLRAGEQAALSGTLPPSPDQALARSLHAMADEAATIASDAAVSALAESCPRCGGTRQWRRTRLDTLQPGLCTSDWHNDDARSVL